MSNTPIKNDDIIVMLSASMGTDFTIEKISNSAHKNVLAVLEELSLLNMVDNEINPQEYLANKGFQMETIISSDGTNEDKEIFYDYNFDVDIDQVILATDFPIKKQTEFLINRLSFSQEILSHEEKTAIIKASEKINDISRIQKLIDDIAIEGNGITHGGIDGQIKEMIEQATNDRTFDIYQIKPGDQYREIRFENSDYLKLMGKGVDPENYELVYSDRLSHKMDLEAIFSKFNINRPDDFKGHSLSVSDIIVVNSKEGAKAHFVDSFGFKEVPEFVRGIEKGNKPREETKRLSILDAIKEAKAKSIEKNKSSKKQAKTQEPYER